MARKAHPGRVAAKEAWEDAFGAPPPSFLSVQLMEAAAAYARQCKASGGRDTETRKRLRAALRKTKDATSCGPSLAPGACLVREWNGRTYRVTVTESGFQMEDQTFKSLSAIARQITGTAWSGPRFFGLNGNGRKAS